MDGVIVNSEPEYLKVEMALFKRFNIRFEEEDQNRYRGINPLVMWKEIKEQYDLKQTVEELYDIEAKMIQKYYEKGKLEVIGSMPDLIKEAYDHGYSCAVVSSSDKENIHHVLRRLNLSRFFKAVVSNNDVKRCKPMPDIFLLAAERLGVKPGECIVIEDSNAGVAAAKAADMKVVQYCDHMDCRLSDADWAAGCINEITLARLEALMQ